MSLRSAQHTSNPANQPNAGRLCGMARICEADLMSPAVPEGMTRTTLTMPVDLWRKVRMAALANDTTATALVQRFIAEGLERLDQEAAK